MDYRGYPCTVKTAWSPDRNTYDDSFIDIAQGDEGWIVHVNDDQRWCTINLPRKQLQGTVPQSFIVPHLTRLYGQTVLQSNATLITSTSTSPNMIRTPTNIMEYAIIALVDAMYQQQSRLTFLSDNMIRYLNDASSRKALVNALIDGMNPRFKAVLLNPDATLADFQVQKVKKGDSRKGLYYRQTQNFVNQPGRLPEVYIGHTMDSFWGRFTQHKVPQEENFSRATNSVRDADVADGMDLYPICEINSEDLNLILVAEQIGVLLTGTYIPEYYRIDQSSQAFVEGNLDSAIKNVTMENAAKQLISLSNAVFSVKINGQQFVPLCRRSSFKTGEGLNMQSPITETAGNRKLMWIKIVQPQVRETYHRTGIPLNKNSLVKIKAFTRYADNAPGDLEASLIASDGSKVAPPTGTEIFAVFEIQLNGPHPVPYARLPEVGPFSDWDIARRLGLKLEWRHPTKQGAWCSVYYQTTKPDMNEDAAEPGALRSYALAMSIIRYLKQRSAFQPRPWDVDCGIADVKELKYNHAAQILRLEDVLSTGDQWRSVYITDDQLRQKMEAAGFVNVNGPFGLRDKWRNDNDANLAHLRTPRQKQVDTIHAKSYKCDPCRLKQSRLNQRGNNAFACNKMPDSDRCYGCFGQGVFCAWTIPSQDTDAMTRAVVPTPYIPPSVEYFNRRDFYVGDLIA